MGELINIIKEKEATVEKVEAFGDFLRTDDDTLSIAVEKGHYKIVIIVMYRIHCGT
jgi:hypothetical protein